MARSPANVRSSTSAAQPHHRLTGEIRALRHQPQGPFFVPVGGGGQGVGALYDHRCTRRASMHLAYLRALGDLLCSWKNSMHLGNSDAPGDRFQPKKQSLGASKFVKCTEDFEMHRSLVLASKIRGAGFGSGGPLASVYSTQVWKSVCNCSKCRWKNVMYVRFTIICAREELRCA